MLNRQRSEKQHSERGEGKGKGEVLQTPEHFHGAHGEDHGGACVPLQLMEQILIHIAACGRPLSGASGCFLKDMWPVEKELERRIVTLAAIPNLSYAIWGCGKIEELGVKLGLGKDRGGEAL